MKALEILNLKIVEQVLNLENREKLYEAIEELEELQNRSCENCKYVSIDTLGFIYCASPKSPLSSCLFAIHPNFSCSKWEQK